MKRKDFLRLSGAAAAASLVPLRSGLAQALASGGGKTRVSVKLLDLQLRYAWGLSRGTWTTRRNAFVRIERDGTVGMGEAAPIARYNETAEGAAAFIEKARPVLERDLWEYAVRWNELEALAPTEHAAKAALDMALLDWVGKKLNVPLWKLLGLNRGGALTTTYSIGIDEVPVMQQKVRESPDFGVYKIKVGSKDDRKIIEGIRAVTSKPLRADANEGWKTKEEALEMINWMAGLGVELIEQPMPAAMLKDYAWLKERSKLPIFADESLMKASDIPRHRPLLPRPQHQAHEMRRDPGGRAHGGHGPGPGPEAHDRLHGRDLARDLGRRGHHPALRPRRPRREPPHRDRPLPGRPDGQGPARPQRQARPGRRRQRLVTGSWKAAFPQGGSGPMTVRPGW